MGKAKKEKSLEEIYREAREKEGPVVIPPQVDRKFLEDLEKISKIEKFGELLTEFKKYQTLATEKPGEMVPGNMILGAPSPEYWEPSEEEKRLGKIGAAIGSVLSSAKDKATIITLLNSMITTEIFVDQIAYVDVHFQHVDVVGSGRFIYPYIGFDTLYSILDHIGAIIDKKDVKTHLATIKKALKEPKIELLTIEDFSKERKVVQVPRKGPEYKVLWTMPKKETKKSVQNKKELFKQLLNLIS